MDKQARAIALKRHQQKRNRSQISLALLLVLTFILAYQIGQFYIGLGIGVILSIVVTGWLHYKESQFARSMAPEANVKRLISRQYIWTFLFMMLPSLILFVMVLLGRPLLGLFFIVAVAGQYVVQWYYEQQIRLLDPEQPRRADVREQSI
ncbi:hypothetical protein EVJ20_12760 [Exiguobacterium sp. SH0S1]|uniref:hypothetical protein n=1 Tax=Exiguobacterium sp. SH0S1 TaxID=2510949 RepID=UPI00103B0F37|nr:hypothetical protein [Exiguobacterium sp. SH0S1]TCI75844.1 hypothetical protein EVJ20_12760 [Exiguobacterium sp. SH0S1]